MTSISAAILIVGIFIRNFVLLETLAKNVIGTTVDEASFDNRSFENIPRFRSRLHNQVGIVHGKPVDIKDYPFMVYIYGVYSLSLCGGTIIGEKWILTAAKCLFMLNLNDTYAIGNTSYFPSHEDTIHIHKIVEIHIHAKFKESSLDYNIGVASVKVPFTGIYEKPIPFADSKYKYHIHTPVTVLGWGKNTSNPIALKGATQLKRGEMLISPHRPCKYVYEKLNYLEITGRHVCAYGWGQGICGEDLGGPLYQNGKIIGIALHGSGCDPSIMALDAFTRVSKFNKFIRKIIGWQT